MFHAMICWDSHPEVIQKLKVVQKASTLLAAVGPLVDPDRTRPATSPAALSRELCHDSEPAHLSPQTLEPQPTLYLRVGSSLSFEDI